MKKISILLASVATLALAAPAFAADETSESSTKIEKNDNGSYSEKDSTSASDSTGKTTDDKSVKVKVGSDGSSDKTVKTEKTKKTGMFHKDKTKTKDTTKTNADGSVKTTHKKVVNGTTTENTTSTTPAQPATPAQ